MLVSTWTTTEQQNNNASVIIALILNTILSSGANEHDVTVLQKICARSLGSQRMLLQEKNLHSLKSR